MINPMKHRSAFALAELLVVAGVIAVNSHVDLIV